ncbi:MAG: ABC transporter permease [Ethanoligenens sp.]
MNSIFTIFRFTFREQARKKSFLISTIILMIVAVAMVVVPAIITQSQSSKPAASGTKSVLYLDDETAVTLSPDTVQKALPAYTVKFVSAEQADSLRRSVLKDDKDDVLVVFKETGSGLEQTVPSFTYYTKDKDNGPGAETLARLFQTMREKHLLRRSDTLTESQADYILQPVQYHTQTGSADSMTGFIPAIAVCILLFITIFSYGYWVAMSIASEKTSRVLEILITSTKPSRIVIGKSLAMGALGLSQLLLVLCAGGVAYGAAGRGSGLPFLSLAGFTPFYVVFLLVYFVLGFALYAMLNAVAGATVSNADDVRSAVQPITMLGMVSFYLAYFAFMAPHTPLSLVASLIPFSAPFSMPARLMMAGGVPWWQVALSLLLLAGTTCALAALSIRLYASAVLHYGRRLKLADLFRLAKQAK